MRALLLLVATFACSSPAKPPVIEPKPDPVKSEPVVAPPKKEKMASDTPRTTTGGNPFVVPAEWTVYVQGSATIVEPPEPGTTVAIVDLQAKSSEEALDLAWKAFLPDHKWAVENRIEVPDKDGWSKISQTAYVTSPAEQRIVVAIPRFANGIWTVVIVNAQAATAEKRGSQFGLLFGKLQPKGFDRESFANKKANPLDAKRLGELTAFIENAQKTLNVPGVALGIIQGGKVVFAGGFGVRALGKPAKIDADTKMIIASNSKALTTLMLGKLVDEKKLTWESTATSLLPQFKLGDADTTSKVLVKHLICACTGMPRQDLEWLVEYKKLTPDTVLVALGGMQPTSKFGELFQYSNVLAAAAGFLGGHVAYPKLELGKAYDEAMRTRVFEPLKMTSTTLDFRKGQTGNFALPHGEDLDGKVRLLDPNMNNAVIPVRPAGGVWSTVRDMLKYVQMELSEGKTPDGKQYIARDTLMARRAPQVAIGQDAAYGMGLVVSTRGNITVIDHGGDIFGFHSDMIWLPEHDTGAVIIVNGDNGGPIRSAFKRKLIEVLFDGKPEADTDIATTAKLVVEQRAVARKQIEVPANAEAVKGLAAKYSNDKAGEIAVKKTGPKIVFDFGEVALEMATKQNPDKTVSFVSIDPGLGGLELVPGTKDGKKTLVLRDAQHEYVFVER
ncbi:MAG: serine hydrolase domain-containing protein [Kofleriaceae bacterium]